MNEFIDTSRILKRFRMNELAIYSITRPYEAELITKCIINSIGSVIKKDLSEVKITDATAGVGGDTISFCKYFSRVNSVELDKDTYNLLIKNCEEFRVKDKVRLFNNNYLDIMYMLELDIIYFDPPWGGIGYKEKDSVDLKLSNSINDEVNINIPIHKIIKYIFLDKLAKIVFLKGPLNMNEDGLNELTNLTINKVEIVNKVGVPSFILWIIN